MRLKQLLFYSGLFAIAFGHSAFAQQGEFETSYNENFLQRSPLIGTKPEVKIFDARGQAFDLSSAEGKYTVVVFGCLT